MSGSKSGNTILYSSDSIPNEVISDRVLIPDSNGPSRLTVSSRCEQQGQKLFNT